MASYSQALGLMNIAVSISYLKKTYKQSLYLNRLTSKKRWVAHKVIGIQQKAQIQ